LLGNGVQAGHEQRLSESLLELRAGMFRLCVRPRKMLINGHLLLDQLVIPLLIVPE